MSHRTTCRCGQLSVTVSGTPTRISACHCLDCKKRSGSAFAAQVRFPDEDVSFAGEYRDYTHVGDSGARAIFRFCPVCGSTVSYVNRNMPGVIALPIGALDDPFGFAPTVSVWEERRNDWVTLDAPGMEHLD